MAAGVDFDFDVVKDLDEDIDDDKQEELREADRDAIIIIVDCHSKMWNCACHATLPTVRPSCDLRRGNSVSCSPDISFAYVYYLVKQVMPLESPFSVRPCETSCCCTRTR